jgi:hypothetical protein
MAKTSHGTGRLVGGLFALAGVVLLGAGAWSGHRQYTILEAWPKVEAEVVASRVTHSTSRDSKRASDTTFYRAEIDFRYVVAGREYVTPAATSYGSSSYPEMKRIVDAHPVGSRHTVWVNPRDANDIRYDAGWTFGFFLFPLIFGGMGIVFAALGLAFVFLARSAPAPLCPACGGETLPGQRFCPSCGARLASS